MAKRRHEDAHGITMREKEVLDRSDSGMPAAQIAREVGLDLNYVRQLIGMYPISNRAELRWIAAAVTANRNYVAAVTATGRSFA